MESQIVLSKIAEKRLENLFDYLEQGWPKTIKSDFIQKLDKCFEILKENPEIFPESRINVGLRKCVVTKQNTLFYRFDKKYVKIVTIFDSRQNLNKLRSDIK